MYKDNFIDYLRLERHYSELTVKAYSDDIDAFEVFVAQTFGEILLHRVSYSEIRSWIVEMMEVGLSSRSINRRVSALKAYYKFLLKTKTITTNPLAKHKSLKISKRVQLPFSEQEVSAVVVQGEPPFFDTTFDGVRDRFIIELLYATGIRRAELIHLKVSNLDIVAGQLKVMGKLHKERIVPLTSKAIDAATDYLIKRETLPCITAFENLLLTKQGKAVSATLVYRLVNKCFKKVSSKQKSSPHILRHTFATHLLNNGADLNAIKELLGHSSLSSTQVYTNSTIAMLKNTYKIAHPREKLGDKNN